MSDFRHCSIVPAQVEEVFGWHERPGAISRLVPPWQPTSAAREASSLRDGTAVLSLPLGLRWVARHEPAGYDRPHQFVDRLDNPPLGAVLSWRHTHRFEAVTTESTRVVDEVRTSLPGKLLRPMFTYRHDQLAADLTTLNQARLWGSRTLTVAVTGSSGLVGTDVCALLGTAGHRVVRLVRHRTSKQGERHWEPEDPDEDLLQGVDVVVHLAGASIAGRFTERRKAAIRDSRLEPTRRLAELAAQSPGVRAFVSASGIGYYGADRGEELLGEGADPGEGFLADVVRGWEAATEAAAAAGLRTVQVRTGIVQSPRGGALRLQRPLFEAGLGGRLGDGHQWLSWIGIDDLADIYLRAVVDDNVSGPVNAVAPHAVRGEDYTRTLARVLRRPALIPVPRVGPRLMLGSEGAAEVAFASQHVEPLRLQELGHSFRHPQLTQALCHLLGRRPADR